MKCCRTAFALLIGLLIISGSIFRFGTPFQAAVLHPHLYEVSPGSKAGDINIHIHFNLSDTDPQPPRPKVPALFAEALSLASGDWVFLPEQPGLPLYHPPKQD